MRDARAPTVFLLYIIFVLIPAPFIHVRCATGALYGIPYSTVPGTVEHISMTYDIITPVVPALKAHSSIDVEFFGNFDGNFKQVAPGAWWFHSHAAP